MDDFDFHRTYTEENLAYLGKYQFWASFYKINYFKKKVENYINIQFIKCKIKYLNLKIMKE